MGLSYIILIVAAIVILLIIWAVLVNNKLVKLRNNLKSQYSLIDIQLKKRFDLIPNLVNVVKAYSIHESETLKSIVKIRNEALNSKDVHEGMNENIKLTKALNNLFVLGESYPELKADTSYIKLQENLKDIEDKIAYARQFYNDSVLKYQNAIEVFPASIIAKLLNFKNEEYYEIKSEEKENIEVNLNKESK